MHKKDGDNMDFVKYTVLMSVYKKEKKEYLRKSIKSMIEQTAPPDEFIIVKDGPLTKDLEEVIDLFRLQHPKLFKIITNEKNMGLGPALAKGIIASKNELIARMDSDDISDKDRCRRQLEIFNKYPDLEMVGCYETEFVNDINNVISIHSVPKTHSEIKKYMRRRCAVLHPTVMYKKSTVLRCGNYQDVKLYEDYDLFARMIFEYDVQSYNIQESLYYIRTSADFFQRRGGLEYARTVLKFKNGLFRKGYMSLLDFIISGLGQAFVCILPNGVRKAFYLRCLRQR